MVLSKKEMGEKIKEARKLKAKAMGIKKYTQQMLADDANKSQSYIGDFEAGRTYPNYVMLSAIAKACGVPLSFFEGAESKSIFGDMAPVIKRFSVEYMKENLYDDILKMVSEENGINAEAAKKLLNNDSEWNRIYDNKVALESKIAFADIYSRSYKLSPEEHSAHDKAAEDEAIYNKVLFPINSEDLVIIPVLGLIRAGQPMLAEENIKDYISIDKRLINGSRVFGLRVVGDSMNLTGINQGDTVIVKEQPWVENGEIGVVLVNGYDATVKRIYIKENQITLMPQSSNPDHQPQIYSQSDNIKIIGKVIEMRRKY